MKTALITGASSGIGKKMVELFSQNGWKVYMLARSKDKLNALEQSIPNTVAWICDLSNKEQLKNIEKSLADLPQLDALVNNAGIYLPDSTDMDLDSVWEKQFQTNLMGPVHLTQSCWTQLSQSKGCIVNISSTLGIRPIPNTAAYSASKAAMNNWTLSLALKGAPLGIRANAICPGIVDTPIHSYYGSEKTEDIDLHQQLQGAQPLGRTGRPEDIASHALHLCSEGSAWTTGSIINIDGGILLNS